MAKPCPQGTAPLRHSALGDDHMLPGHLCCHKKGSSGQGRRTYKMIVTTVPGFQVMIFMIGNPLLRQRRKRRVMMSGTGEVRRRGRRESRKPRYYTITIVLFHLSTEISPSTFPSLSFFSLLSLPSRPLPHSPSCCLGGGVWSTASCWRCHSNTLYLRNSSRPHPLSATGLWGQSI